MPGHGPLAYEKEINLLIRIQEYFVNEVNALVQKNKSLDEILAELEPQLPQWITSIPEVWGTPRYAILRVYRSLTQKVDDEEKGWQQFKPSAIPFSETEAMAHEAAEGGDHGLQLNVLREATRQDNSNPNAWSAYAEALIESSRQVASVLEKGDFFTEANQAWQMALTQDQKHIPSLIGRAKYLIMMAYRGGDNPEEGMQIMRDVLQLQPSAAEEAQAQFYLGMGYRRLGNESKAKQQFELAKLADFSFIPAQLALGTA